MTVLALLVLGSASGLAFGQSTPPASTQPATQESDRWFRMKLAGQSSGWSRTQVRFKAEGKQIETTEEVHLAIRRAGTLLKIDLSTVTLETADGTPIWVKVDQNLGDSLSTTVVDVKPDEFIVTRGRGNDLIREIVMNPPDPSNAADDCCGDSKKRSDSTSDPARHSHPGDPSASPTTRPAIGGSGSARWLPSAAAQRYIAARIQQKATDIQYATMDPSVAVKVKTIHMTNKGTETINVMGKAVLANLWIVTLTGMEALPTKMWLDDRAEPVRVATSLLPGMDLVADACTEAQARMTISPHELLVSTLITPDREIVSPRKRRTGNYELHFVDSEKVAGFKPPKIPRTGAQRVVWDNRTTALVVLDLDDTVTPEGDLPTDADLKSNLHIDCDNPKVQATLGEALKSVDPKADASVKAESLRKFVYQFITHKDLSVGMGSASETIDSKHGDCTEHAVLLAALLRAAKIPSRTVMGLVYADAFAGRKGIFGYHMWTEAWLDLPNEEGQKVGRWVDLDATLSQDDSFDATHIAMLVSSLADDRSSEEMVGMASVVGRMTIHVVVSDPADQAPEATVSGAATRPALPATMPSSSK